MKKNCLIKYSLYFLKVVLKILEKDFQHFVIKILKAKFPEGYILKNDASYVQGIPDIIMLYENKWIALEIKRSCKSSKRPNQEYHVNKMNAMSFSRFVYPENFDEVIKEISDFLCEKV